MTTAKWKQLRIYLVEIRLLIATQDGVYIHALMDNYTDSYSTDHIPHVVSWRGRLYLEDGHHRVIRSLIKGATHTEARVLEIGD